MIGDHLGGLEPGARGNLGACAVLVAGLDAGDALLEAVAADDDQFALLDPERNIGRLRRLDDRGGLIVSHAIDHIEAPLRRKPREQLAGDALAEIGLPLGILY